MEYFVRMQPKEKQSIIQDINIQSQDKISNNIYTIMNKVQPEFKENYNIINPQNNEMEQFKSDIKIYKPTNPSK